MSQDIPEFVSFPRLALTGPMFTLDRRGEGWSVAVEEDEREVTYEIGTDAGSGLLTGSLTVDDAEVLVGLLSFADFADGPQVRFGSLHSLGSRIWGNSYSQPTSLRLVNRLGHLKGTAIVRREEGNPRAPLFTCLSDWDLAQWSETGDWLSWDLAEKADGQYRASWVTFSNGFLKWMKGALDIDVATFLGMRSRLGRGLYLYLPSRAYPPRRYSPDRPRTFELGEILEQIGGRVPGTRSQRLQMFERPDRKFSVTKELDTARLWCGKFRFQLEERPAPYDHRIRCWIEADPGVAIAKQELLPLHSAGTSDLPSYERGGALFAAWKAAGGTEDRWLARRATEVEPSDLEDEIAGLIEDGILSEEMAGKNRAAIILGLKILSPAEMRRVRGAVMDRVRTSGADSRSAVESKPRFWMGCLKDAIRTAAQRAVAP